jgi:hypothetical protein
LLAFCGILQTSKSNYGRKRKKYIMDTFIYDGIVFVWYTFVVNINVNVKKVTQDSEPYLNNNNKT